MKQKLFKLLLTTMCIALIVVLTGWYTDAKQVIHSMLISCMVFAFLPFCIILAIVAVLVLLSFILIIIGFCLGGEVGSAAGNLVG